LLAKLALAFDGIALAIFVESRTRAKDALKDAETKLKTILNTIPDLEWLKDINGAYVGCNARFERFVGKKEYEIIGMTDYDFFDKELADFFEKMILPRPVREALMPTRKWLRL